MKRHSLPFAYLSRLEGSCARWLMAHGGSGLSCCFLIIGALYGLYLGCGFAALPALPLPWEGLCRSLGKVAVALLLAAASHAVLLSLAACSAGFRKSLTRVTALLAEVPALCLLGGVAAVFSPFWSVAGVAGFSLIVRSLHATLRAGDDIPSDFLKTARALRLGRWQSFWRLHVPFAFPVLVQSVLRDLPDFWLRILGGELVLSLFMPHQSPGLGGIVFTAMGQGQLFLGVEVFSLALVLIFLVQHGLIIPLLGHGRRYEVCNLPAMEKDRLEERSSPWAGNYALPLGLCGSVVATACLSYGMWPWPGGYPALVGPAAFLVAGVVVLGGIWGCIGGLGLGLSEKPTQSGLRFCLVLALFPVFLLLPVLSGHFPIILLPILAVMGSTGWAVLHYAIGAKARRLVHMGQQLRLPWLSLWQHIRLPLLAPALLQAGVVVLPFFWDNVYLALLLSDNAGHDGFPAFHAMLSGNHYGTQGLFLCLMTLLAVSVRWGIFIPLQERMARHYRV